MPLEQFATSPKGKRFLALLARQEAQQGLIAAARQQRPAVEAIDAMVADDIGALSDDERKAAGRLVKRESRNLGLVPWKKGQRVRGGRVFTSGTVYRDLVPAVPAPSSPPAASPSPVAAEEWLARIEKARAILAAGRRDPAVPLGTVDDFLAERRAMWGEA